MLKAERSHGFFIPSFSAFVSCWKSVGILDRFESLIYEKFRKT